MGRICRSRYHDNFDTSQYYPCTNIEEDASTTDEEQGQAHEADE